MKLRVTGLLLASLMVLSVTASAFAASGEPEADEGLEVIETNVSTSPFYLGDQQLSDLEYELIGGINYVTVESFLTAMSHEAMVEEENGVVSASSVTVTEIIDVDADEAEFATANVMEEALTFSAGAGDCYVVANGRCLYVDTGVQRVNGKVAVPIRILADVFNLVVEYDSTTRHVQLVHREGEGAYLTDGECYYDEETLYWLSHIIGAESGNQSLDGKIAVGNVVMNRLASPLFPNTIKGVLFQKNQFSPASSGSIYREPNSESVLAAKLVLDGACVLQNALFFNRAGMNSFAARNRTYVATIGAHAFYN